MDLVLLIGFFSAYAVSAVVTTRFIRDKNTPPNKRPRRWRWHEKTCYGILVFAGVRLAVEVVSYSQLLHYLTLPAYQVFPTAWVLKALVIMVTALVASFSAYIATYVTLWLVRKRVKRRLALTV